MRLLNVRKDSPLTLSERLTYSAMWWKNKRSVSAIARTSGLSRPTVRLALKRLSEMGLSTQEGHDHFPKWPTSSAKVIYFVSPDGQEKLAYVKLPKAVQGISPYGRTILGYVQSTQKKGKHPGKRALARLTGLDSRTVARQVDRLVSLGYLKPSTSGYVLSEPATSPEATPAAPPEAATLEVPPATVTPPEPVQVPTGPLTSEELLQIDTWDEVKAHPGVEWWQRYQWRACRQWGMWPASAQKLGHAYRDGLIDQWADVDEFVMLCYKVHCRNLEKGIAKTDDFGRYLTYKFDSSGWRYTQAMKRQEEFYLRSGGRKVEEEEDELVEA